MSSGIPSDTVDDPEEQSCERAVRIARLILYAVLASYLSITVLNLLSLRTSAPALAMGLVTLALIFMLQLWHSAPGTARAPVRTKLLTLGAQAVLTFLPLAWFGIVWGAMAGFLAGSLLVLLPARWGWSLYGAVTLVLGGYGISDRLSLIDFVYVCQTTALTGLVVYAVTRLVDLIVELHQARAKLARLAVAEERLRFSRDLHDLLGFSLSSITLKNELIHRLIAIQPERARTEVEEVLTISRQALADVRRVASEYRQMSLVDEIASARSVLAAAGLEASVTVDERLTTLDPRLGTILATVLREGMTNVLRHSKATHCSIEAAVDGGTVRLVLLNDGLTAACGSTSPHGGSGLGNLAQRLEVVGGSLQVKTSGRPGGSGEFRLSAEIPVYQAASSGSEYARSNPGARASGS